MHQIYISWVISAVVLAGIAVLLGLRVTPWGRWFGILIDNRGRVSLTHLQLVVWSLLILSLISGVFFGRWWAGVADPLGFDIPDQVLGLMGIATGSAVAATITKSAKDNDPTASERIPATSPPASRGGRVPTTPGGLRPSLRQVFTVEEGALADQVVDVTKFQNFAITLVLVVAYTGLAWKAIGNASAAVPLAALPSLPSQFLTLLGISHAGYVAGKLPNQSGLPPGDQTVASRDARRYQAADPATARRLHHADPVTAQRLGAAHAQTPAPGAPPTAETVAETEVETKVEATTEATTETGAETTKEAAADRQPNATTVVTTNATRRTTTRRKRQ